METATNLPMNGSGPQTMERKRPLQQLAQFSLIPSDYKFSLGVDSSVLVFAALVASLFVLVRFAK